MFDDIMKVLGENGINISILKYTYIYILWHKKNCLVQSYDNPSAMGGKYNGFKSKIITENRLATWWVPCAAYSLNLVGKVAAECCSSAISFFGFSEAIYNFTKKNFYHSLIMSIWCH